MATGTALQPQKKSKHSYYLLAGVLILVALVQGWVLGGGNTVKEGAACVVGLAPTHIRRQSPLHSIQRPEGAVFHSRERILQLPLNEQTLGPDRGYETGGAHF